MLVSLEGDESSGKTTWAYTAPLPIVGFAFDMGFERALFGSKYVELFEGLDIEVIRYDPTVVEPAPFTADITIFELPAPVQFSGTKVKGYSQLWGYFITRIAAGMTDPRIRSLVVDTMTSARRVRADAHLEELQAKARPDQPERVQLIQIEWGKPNDDIRNLYTTSQGVRRNLVAVHHLTDERKDGVDRDGKIVQGMLTGQRVMEGLNNTYRLVDVALRMEKVGASIKAKFQKCGYNLSLEGTALDNPNWNTLVDQILSFTPGKLMIDRSTVGEKGDK